MFKKFADYMYYLLIGPLKKVAKKDNQFYILFKVFGKLFDQTKQDIFRVREESMIISASEIMLGEHGLDRDMKRLKGEGVENYRTRLSMKNIIAEKAGTNTGILLALKALGYEQSYIEPFYIYDPERWAEFIVYLGGKNPSGINDIGIIDNEVMKVKPASGKPSYGIEEGTRSVIKSAFRNGFSKYPLCNTISCGRWPLQDNFGKLLESVLASASEFTWANVNLPLAGTIAASERVYQGLGYVDYCELSTVVEKKHVAVFRDFRLTRCNEIIAGQYPEEQSTTKVFESDAILKGQDYDGGAPYPLCGEIKAKGMR